MYKPRPSANTRGLAEPPTNKTHWMDAYLAVNLYYFMSYRSHQSNDMKTFLGGHLLSPPSTGIAATFLRHYNVSYLKPHLKGGISSLSHPSPGTATTHSRYLVHAAFIISLLLPSLG